MPQIDPLTLAVVRGSLEQLAEEMDLTLKRTAFSPVISEGNRGRGGFVRGSGTLIWLISVFLENRGLFR